MGVILVVEVALNAYKVHWYNLYLQQLKHGMGVRFAIEVEDYLAKAPWVVLVVLQCLKLRDSLHTHGVAYYDWWVAKVQFSRLFYFLYFCYLLYMHVLHR